MRYYKLHLILKKQSIIIDISKKQTILDKTDSKKVSLPYACRIGNCSACLGSLLRGSLLQNKSCFLTKNQLKNHFNLTCVTKLLSNLILKINSFYNNFKIHNNPSGNSQFNNTFKLAGVCTSNSRNNL